MAQRRFTRHKRSRLSPLLYFFARSWLRIGLLAAGILFLFGAGTILWWSKDIPNPQNINANQMSQSTKIFDRTGEHVLYEIGDIHRTSVSLDNISNYLRQATLATEDDQFYQHHGIDLWGIARGVILKPLTGQRVQGGSTITQQLIKNSILTSERTIQRKAKEAVLAVEMEQRFSKDQILEMYLNEIPYGSQAYGVEAAAREFFGTSAKDITLAQAATIAALPQAPSYYSPYGSHREDLKTRQEHVLQRMADLKMITPEQADQAEQEELNFSPRRESIIAPHFVFYVKELLEQEYGERVVEQGGLNIITTLDLDMQTKAEETLKEQEAPLNKLGASNAALTAINPQTGDILAMVGSIDYFNEDIDGNVNVAIRHRSPGSSIKPFVYAAAFQRGYTPDSILVDAETDFGQGYRPKNYNLKEHGPVTMRAALANSLNIPAVKTLYLAGVKESTQLAQSMGMDSLNDPDRYGLSLVLGGGEVRLVDEVSAYGVFANDGVRSPHRAILKVSDKNDTLFDSSDNQEPSEQVLDPQITREITDILSDNNARGITFGPNSYLQLGSRPVAAKTGTTQDFRDGWAIGYTPSLVAGVWVGNNDNSPMGDRSPGASTAAPTWNKFMKKALSGQTIEQFTKPAPLENIPYPVLRGEIPEVKAKWEINTNTIYSADCPVSVGIPKTFKELHNILFYVRRANPLGPPPADAESDPQFDRWESGVSAWRNKHNEETKNDQAQPYYGSSLPEPSCNIGNPEDIPTVRIVEPNDTIIRQSPVIVSVEVDSPKPLQEVRFLLDSQEIGSRRPDEPYTAAFSFPSDFSGRKTLQILAITEDKLIGRAHRTFIINPDDTAPSVTLHTPPDGITLKPTNFPYAVKVTATDPSGVESVDVLYRKDGTDGTQRIGRTSTLSPTAANRYEVTWTDSPGLGQYDVYAIIYDKTGNFTETDHRLVYISD
ncbi:MAG: PBP1A family penicillin-binding protein [Candidatus Andersenbacteria bacterium]|nr:PBP1A family penicillin-binding protein [bacterium]MDZ4225646.1 PBP1A family penicillin-binding protein [Candidatus Andersenbacteria bacterium]